MFAFSEQVDIGAPLARVWRALCDPDEVCRWDSGIVEAIDALAGYPQAGQHVRWRYANAPFRILHDRPREVEPERTLRSLISVGPFRFDETYTLEPRDGGCLLRASMIVRAPLPVVGWIIERLYLRGASQATVRASLRSIKRHCESGEGF